MRDGGAGGIGGGEANGGIDGIIVDCGGLGFLDLRIARATIMSAMIIIARITTAKYQPEPVLPSAFFSSSILTSTSLNAHNHYYMF